MLRMRRYATGLAAVLLLAQPVALAPVGANAPTYTIEDLGTVDGLVPTVTGINASGQVSGFVFTSTGSRAVRFVDPGGWSVRARARVAAQRRARYQRLRRSDGLCRHVRWRLARLSLHRDDRSARVHPADGHRLVHRGHRHQRVGRGDRLRRHWRSRGRDQVVSRLARISRAEAAKPERDAGHRVRHQRRRAGGRSGNDPGRRPAHDSRRCGWDRSRHCAA